METARLSPLPPRPQDTLLSIDTAGLAQWFVAAAHFQGQLSDSILGTVLRQFQQLCLVFKQKLFRWEQSQLAASVIFTRPLNPPDLQFPSFPNERLDHVGKKAT